MAASRQCSDGRDARCLGAAGSPRCCTRFVQRSPTRAAAARGRGRAPRWLGLLAAACAAEGAAAPPEAAAAEVESRGVGLEDAGPAGVILFNDALPALAAGIRRGLELHALYEQRDEVECSRDGSVRSESLRAARAEVVEALSYLPLLPGHADHLPSNQEFEKLYNSYEDAMPSCPQAVLQATLSKLDRLLLHLRETCAEMAHIRMCQANTPFMFDIYLSYAMLKHGLIELYSDLSLGANVTPQDAFRGWPIAEVEERTWYSFGELWRVIWPERDHCSCVEAYDYYTTMHSLFDRDVHLQRADFRSRLLRHGSEARQMVDDAEHCDEWLAKDFLRIFSSYAKLSACLPGAILENVVCLQRWLLSGKVMGALNTAEMMAKLLTLSGTCLDDTYWPFTKADVLRNFAHVALHWAEADVGCEALSRFGERLSQEPCPTEISPAVLHRMLWAPSPLQHVGRMGSCTRDFPSACVVDGAVAPPPGGAAASGGGAAAAPPFLEACSETGHSRHRLAVESSADDGEEEGDGEEASEAALAGQQLGFVLNLPEASTNIWHNVHWLVPAVARLHGAEAGARPWAAMVPGRVVLLLLYHGNSFLEGQMQAPAGEQESLQEQERELQGWVVQYAPLLRLLTSSPPILLRGVKRRCFRPLLFGHAAMRADRELRHPGAVRAPELRLFRAVLAAKHGADLEYDADLFWRAVEPDKCGPIRVLLVQRDAADLRRFEALEELVAAGLEPLARDGVATWQQVDDLGQQPLLFQAAIFRSAEVLIGAVGAALAWLVVMRPGSQVLEWLPPGVPPSLYRCSETWNSDPLGMFGGLGRLAEVDHVCLRSSEGEPAAAAAAAGAPAPAPGSRKWSGVKSLTAKQAYWRRRDLKIDPDKFRRWTAEAVRRAARTRRCTAASTAA